MVKRAKPARAAKRSRLTKTAGRVSTADKPLPVSQTRAVAERALLVDATRVRHELEVHQAELETQNHELRSARNELEAALAAYTELFDFGPIGYATIDETDVIRNLNFAAARVLGVARAKLVGTRFGGFIAPADTRAYNALVACVRASGDTRASELRARCGGELDTPSVLRVTATVQPRTPGRLLLAFEDVTRHKAEQEQLAEAERALRDANLHKDDFLAMLSHELRNPLTPIRTSLYVLAGSTTDSATALRAREIIERQVTYMTRLIDDLLDVTRISRGKLQLQRERLDLVELVRRAVEDQHAGFEANEVKLSVASSPEPLWAEVDPTRIVQAVSNLLVNARNFTPPGGRVDVALRRRNGAAELRVRDTGSGIAPELLPHVFESFTQAPQTLDRTSGGLGLGLAMVKGFVELHGGSVKMTSAGTGRGAEATVTLPLAAAAPSKSRPARPALASRRVLVIEDQPDTANALETALTMLGLEVRVANTGPAGLELAHAFHPEVVVCDVGLPGMNGHEVARAFRGDRELRDAYLIAFSGYARPDDIQRATEAGFSRHLAKPASLETLARVIAEAP